MVTKPRWFTSAIRGLRSFAYGDGVSRPKVGLALGGGFARGIAHIGVLRVLEENHIPIDCIAGTSVGALIAATYASGTPLDEMQRQGQATRFSDFGRWTISRMGIASNERLEHFLHKFTTAKFFHELKIPLSMVAVDLITGESVHLTDGEIAPALRASCAYPGLFLPVEYRGRVLVDGFLTETVPAEAARDLGADIVIGVHLEPGLLHQPPHSMIEVISRSFSILQTAARQQWRTDVDVLIEPDVHYVMWDEFVRTPEMVAAGEAATRAALPQIMAALAAGPKKLARAGDAFRPPRNSTTIP
jgi:NTE family protein